VHDDFQQVANGVGEDMAFVPFDVFVTVKPPFMGQGSSLDTLAVDDAPCGLGITTPFLPLKLAQSGIDEAPGSIPDSLAEVVVDAIPIRKVRRQGSPLTTRAHHVEDGVQDFPEVQCHPTTSSLLDGDQGSDHLPFLIAEITVVTLALHSLSSRL